MNSKLIIGNLTKYESLIRYLEKHDIHYIIFDLINHKDKINRSKNRSKNIICAEPDQFFNPNYYHTYIEKNNLKIDQIINFRDELKWVALENELSAILNLFVINEETLKFLTHKSYQDDVCKKLSIPTIPLNKDKNLMVKKDAGYSGGNGFYITTFEKITNFNNIFLQNYIDIDYTLAVQCYIDDSGNWYILNYHKITYVDNCPMHSISPYFGDDKDTIKDYIKLLKSKITLSNRIIFWQFVKEKNGLLYNMDFNCRPAGGFEAGSYDTDISDNNWLDYFIRNKMPETITFNNTVEIFYKNKQTFGYSDYSRVKTPMNNLTCKVEKL